MIEPLYDWMVEACWQNFNLCMLDVNDGPDAPIQYWDWHKNEYSMYIFQHTLDEYQQLVDCGLITLWWGYSPTQNLVEVFYKINTAREMVKSQDNGKPTTE